MILEDLISTNLMQRRVGNVNVQKMCRCINELERIYGIKNGNNQYKGSEIISEAIKTQKDLAKQIGIDDVPKLLNDVLDTNPIKTGSNAKGLYADYVLNGNTYRVGYGTNGFIVSFYPID